MCFTPIISLSTAIIEFLVGTFILIRYRNTLVSVFSAIFVYVLGLYQFTEFMLCTTNNPHLWAAIGFATYTFLPTIGLHFVLRLTKRKFNKYILYTPAIIFALIAILRSDFVLGTTCATLYVIVRTLFSLSGPYWPIFFVYIGYYFGYFLFMLYLLIQNYKDKSLGKVYQVFTWVSLITILIPLILICLLPALSFAFPSIYCHFSMLFTIAAIMANQIYDTKKEKDKEKFFN